MNILLAHFRVGETDGVSLEMDKWKWALESLGHRVFYLAGSSGSCKAELVPELHYLNAFNDKIIHNAYVQRSDYESDAQLQLDIEQNASQIATAIELVIERLAIDIVVPNNIWSLGYHLSAALGLLQAIERTQTKVICHHHDFHWERVKYSKPSSDAIAQMLATKFPPKSVLIQHCVINRIAQQQLKARRGIAATVVPNVFDFENSNWQVDSYNQDLRQRFGLRDHDVLFLQATRIVSRKGIELAIELIATLNSQAEQWVGKTLYNGQIFTQDSRLVLTFAGMCEEPEYLEKLKQKASALGVELLFINPWVDHSRGLKDGQKVYSLWDVYTAADIVSYPSLLEGWGNQFLEGLVAKLPMIVYRYPVFDLDIADYQFNIIDLGNSHTSDEAGLAVISEQDLHNASLACEPYLFDSSYRQSKTTENYQIGEKSLSYGALKLLLSKVFNQ